MNSRRAKGRNGIKLLSIMGVLMILCFGVIFTLPVSAADGSSLATVEREPDADVTISFPFLDTRLVTYEWGFPYSDDFFRTKPEEFSLRFAQGSLGLSLGAFRSTAHILDPQYEVYLKGAGFTNLFSFGYDKETTEHSLSGVIGMKQIDDFTVIAAVTCGQGYENEWQGNLIVGDGVRHEGFDQAASLLKAYLAEYEDTYDIDGKKKLWLTGISRAGAVANIAAADLMAEGGYKDIYAYLFGVPRTTKEPIRYKGIYNLCGQYDPVASIPLQSWGFERYGTDLFTPAQEADGDYGVLANQAAEIGNQLNNEGFRNNPEINYQLRLILEYMNELLPGSAEYTERFQPLLIKAMKDHSKESFIPVLKSALRGLETDNPQERASVETAIDYLSFMAAQHMRADQRQIRDGSWDPDAPLSANVVLEHRPVTYIKWLFSSDDPDSVLTNEIRARRIILVGDVEVSAYKDGVGITRIDSKGRISIPGKGDQGDTETGKGSFGVFMMKNADETVVCVPYDEEYELIVDSPSGGSVSIYNISISPEKLIPENSKAYYIRTMKGNYSIKSIPEKDLFISETDEDGYVFVPGREFYYSPTVAMSTELSATRHSFLSLSGAYHLLSAVSIALLVLLCLCAITAMIHGYQIRKNGHPPYSDLYVIVPHLIVILIFAALTQYLTFFMFSIEGARAWCAALTMFCIFLLALRGAIRSGDPLRFLICGLLLMFVFLTGKYYNTLSVNAFSVESMLTFCAVVIFFSAFAVSMFRPNVKAAGSAILSGAGGTSEHDLTAAPGTEVAPDPAAASVSDELPEDRN